MLLTYGIIGLIRNPWHVAKIWPVCARFSLEEAQAYFDALEQQVKVFHGWKERMTLSNPKDRWDDLVEDYIEANMLDKHYEVGAVYDILCFKEDSTQ